MNIDKIYLISIAAFYSVLYLFSRFSCIQSIFKKAELPTILTPQNKISQPIVKTVKTSKRTTRIHSLRDLGAIEEVKEQFEDSKFQKKNLEPCNTIIPAFAELQKRQKERKSSVVILPDGNITKSFVLPKRTRSRKSSISIVSDINTPQNIFQIDQEELDKLALQSAKRITAHFCANHFLILKILQKEDNLIYLVQLVLHSIVQALVFGIDYYVYWLCALILILQRIIDHYVRKKYKKLLNRWKNLILFVYVVLILTVLILFSIFSEFKYQLIILNVIDLFIVDLLFFLWAYLKLMSKNK